MSAIQRDIMTGKDDRFYLQVKQIGALTAIPIILLVGPAVGFFIGGWIDRRVQSYPWATVILTAMGFVGAAREIVRLLQQVSKEEK